MLNQNLNQAVTWFNNLDTASKHLVARIILQEKDVDKYLYNDPTRQDLDKFLKNRTTLNIINKLENLERAVLVAEEYSGYKIDFDFIQFLENTTILHIFDALKYANINALCSMKSLQILHLHNCYNLVAFLDLKEFNARLNLIITETNDLFFSTFINITNLASLSIMNCNNITLKTNQHYRFLKEIEIINCKNANIEIDFAKYPNLTTLTIQETQGKISFINTIHANNLSFASVQQLGRTPQIQEILLDPAPQSFELV